MRMNLTILKEEYNATTEESDLPISMGNYLTLCVDEMAVCCVLDTGISVGGLVGLHDDRRAPSKKGNLRYRLTHHPRRSEWNSQLHHRMYYVTLSDVSVENIVAREKRLQWIFPIPCGTNPWERMEEGMVLYSDMRNHHGARGSGSLPILTEKLTELE